ncbi:hypothetical protein JTE90_003767 [Oedothorax gibbosus]|uniref:Uncharacterized protein n=1 Tax=Oedothorax gibbosus TaxID=931172 RepID=A0AAV6V9I9_9ARAC|nr:hypothetical protein JTE90_003767 [Oedothorax gibbosus]
MDAENVDSTDNRNGNSPSQVTNDSIKAKEAYNSSTSKSEFSGDGSTIIENKNGDTIEDWRQDCSNRVSTKLLEAEKADNSFISKLKSSGQSATTSQREPNTTTSKNLLENRVAETETEGFAVPSSDCLLKVFEAEHIDDRKCLVILEKPTKKTAFRICEEPGKMIRMEFEVIAGETVLREENLVDETESSITSEDDLMSSFIKSFSLKSSINKSIEPFEVAEPEIEAHPKQFNVNVFNINNKEFSFVGVTNKEYSSSKYGLKKCNNYTAEECKVPIEEDNSKQSSISNSRIPSKRDRKPRKKRKSSKKLMSKAVSNARSKSNSCNISKNTLDSSENSSFINAIRINGNSFYNDCINSFISNSMIEEMPELEPHIMPESLFKPPQHRASTDEYTMSTKLKITNEEGNQALETLMPILEAQKTDDVPPSNKNSQRTRGRPRKPQKPPKRKPGRPKKQQEKPKKTRGRPKKKIPSKDSILSRNCELCTVSFHPKNSEYTFCEVCADVQRIHGDGSSGDACNRKLTVSDKEVAVQRKSKRKNLKEIIFKKMPKRDKELHVYHNMVARSAVQKTYSHCQSFTGQMVESPGLFNGSEEENTMDDTLEIHPFAQAIAGHEIKTTPKRSKSSKINSDIQINTKLKKDMKKGQNKIARTSKKSFVDSSTMRITRSRSSTPKRKLTMPQNETTQTNKKIKKNIDKHLINNYESLSSNVPILKTTGSKTKRKSKRTKKINTCDDFLEENLFSCETVSNQFKGIENVTTKVVKETNYLEQAGGMDSELGLSDKDLGPLNISTTQTPTACIKYTELNESNTKIANANKESLKLSSTLFKNISKITEENSTTIIQFDDSDNLLSKIQSIISNAGKRTAENPSVSESVSYQTKHAVSGESTDFNSSSVSSTDEKASICSKKKVENSDMHQNSIKSYHIENTARRFRRSLLPLQRCPGSDSFSSESRQQNATAIFEENNIRNEAEIAHKDYPNALFLGRGNKESFTINNFRRNDMNLARDLGLQNYSNFEKDIFKPFFINFDSNVSKLQTVSHSSDDILKNDDSVDQTSPLDLSINNSYKLSVELNYDKTIENEANENMRAENCGDSSNCVINFVNNKDEQFLVNHIDELNSVNNKDEQISEIHKDEPTSVNHEEELNLMNNKDEQTSVVHRDEPTSVNHEDKQFFVNNIDELNSVNNKDEQTSEIHKDEQTSEIHKDEQTSVIHRDERTSVNHEDKQFFVNNIDELNSVNNKDEQTSEIHKDEQTSVNHEDEQFFVNNIDELNSVNNKEEQTSEIHKDEQTSVNQEEKLNSVNNKDEQTTEIHKDEQTTEIHKDEQTTEIHKDEQTTEIHKDEQTSVKHAEELNSVNNEEELNSVNIKDEQTSVIHRDEPTSVNHKDEILLVNNIDELNSVNNKDEQTSEIHKDGLTSVNQEEELNSVNNKDEQTSEIHKDEPTSVNHEEELNLVNHRHEPNSVTNKDEQTSVVHRDEPTSGNHKDEQFLVNNIDELNSVNNKDEQTSEIHKDEPNSVNQEEELNSVNNEEELNSVNIKDEQTQTSVIHRNEPTTVIHKEEQLLVNNIDEPTSINHKDEQFLVNNIDELSSVNNKDEQTSDIHKDEPFSVNHEDENFFVNLIDDLNSVTHKDEQTSVNYEDELYSVNNKYEQTSVIDRDEPNSANHKDEQFLVNHIDELNSVNNKDEQISEIHNDEPTSVNQKEQQFLVNNIKELNSVNYRDEPNSVTHKDEQTSMNHEDEQTSVNNRDKQTSVSHRDELNSANYKDEQLLVNNIDELNSVNNIDELNSVNNKDEQTSEIHKDEPTLVNHEDKFFFVNHTDEQNSVNHEDELSSVNKRDEQTSVIHRDELYSANHKDEQFLVNNIDELNSVNNKVEQTSEIHKDELTSVNHKDEQFLVNHIDDLNSVNHKDEQISEIHKDDTNSINHNDEVNSVNHKYVNQTDEKNSVNHKDDTNSINHNDEVNSVNHKYVNQTDEKNSVNHKDELNSGLRTKDLTIHISKKFEMHSDTNDTKQKLFSDHTAFNNSNDIGYGEPRGEGNVNKNEKTVNSKELLANVLYSNDRKQYINDSVRQVFKTHVSHNSKNQICTDSSSQEILGEKAKFDTSLNQSKTLEMAPMASYFVKNVISDDSSNSKSAEKLGAENKELSISMESITKVNSKIKENFPAAFEQKLISDDCLDDSSRVIAVTSSMETVIDTDPQQFKEKKSQSYASKSAKRKAGKWKIDLKEDLKVRFFFKNVSEKDSVEDCEVKEYPEKHLSYPMDSFQNKTPSSPKINTLLKKNRSKILMLNAKKKLETLEHKNVEDLNNSLPELSGEVPTTLDHNTPVIVSQIPSLNADIATQSQTVAVLHTKNLQIQKIAAENKSFEVYESDSTNACESFRCLKGENLNLSLFETNSFEKEKLEISHSAAEYSKSNPSKILTGNTSLPFRNHGEEDKDYGAVVPPLYGGSASVSQAKIIEQTFPTNHKQNKETENTKFESNEKEATYENVPTTESEQSSFINEKKNLSNFPNYNNIITKHLEVDPNTYCSKHNLSRNLEISTLKNVNTETLAKNIDDSKNIETLNVDLGDNDIEVEIVNSPIGQQDSDNDSDVEKYCIPEEYSATDNDSCSDNENILPLSTNDISFSSHNSDFKINQITNNVKESYCDNVTTKNSPNNHLETLMVSESKDVEIFVSGLGKNQNFEKTMEASKEMRLRSQEPSATIASSNQLLVQVSEDSNTKMKQEIDEKDLQIIAVLPPQDNPATIVSSNPSSIQVSEGSKTQIEQEKDVRDVKIIAELLLQKPVATIVSQEPAATTTSLNPLLAQISEGSNSQINQEQDEKDIQIIAELPSHKHPRTVVSSNPSLIQVSEGSKIQMEQEKDLRDVNIIAELPSQEPVVTRVLQEPASTTTSSNPLLVQVSEGSNTQIKQENDEKDLEIIAELQSQGFTESIVYSHHILAQISQLPKENFEKVLQFVAKLESQEREATIVSPNNSLLQVSEGSGTQIKKENDKNNIKIIAELKPHGNISTQTDSAFQETEKHDKIPSNYPKDNTLCTNTVSTETEETTSDNCSMLHNVPANVMRRIACSSPPTSTNNHKHQQTTTSPSLVQKSTFFATPQPSFMSHQMRSKNPTSSLSLMNSEEQISLPSLSNSEASVESNLGTVPLQFVQPNNHTALELPHNDQLPVLYSSSQYLCGINNNYETLFRQNARYGIQRLSGPQSLSRDTPMMQSNEAHLSAQNCLYERRLAAATPYIQEDNVNYRHGVSSLSQAERTISQTVENVPANESQSSSLISLYGQMHERSLRRDTHCYSSSLSKFPQSMQNTSRYATNFLPTNPPSRGNNVDDAVTTTRIPAVPISQVQNNIFLPTNAFDSGNKACGAAPTPRLQSRTANDVQYPSLNVPNSRRHERVNEMLHTHESNSDEGSLPYPPSFTGSRNLTTVPMSPLGFPSQNYHGRMIEEPNVYHSSQGNNANYYSSMQLSATPMVTTAFEYPLLYHNSETRFTPQCGPNYWHHGTPNLPFRNNSEHSTSQVHGMQVINMHENRNCPTRGGSQQTSLYHSGMPGIPTPMSSAGGSYIERPDRCIRGVLNPSDIPPLPSAEYVQQNQRRTPKVPAMRRRGSVSAAENSTRIMSRPDSVQVTGSAPEPVSETAYRHVTGTAPSLGSGPEPVTVSATACRRLTGTAAGLVSGPEPVTVSSTAYRRVTGTAPGLGSGPELVTLSSTADRRMTATAAGLGSGPPSGPAIGQMSGPAIGQMSEPLIGQDDLQSPVNLSMQRKRQRPPVNKRTSVEPFKKLKRVKKSASSVIDEFRGGPQNLSRIGES